MSIATVETGVTHAGIMEWRDEAALTAMVLIHDAAVAAMQVWDECPSDGTVPNTIGAHLTGWNVRAAMRRLIVKSLQEWGRKQENSLVLINPKFRQIATSFQRLESVLPIPGNAPPDHKDLPGFGWSAATLLVGFTPLRYVPAARKRVFDASRRACLIELAHSWLNPSSGSNSYLALLLNMLDRMARDAKEIVK